MLQYWICDVCGKGGSVEFEEGEDVFVVVFRIEDDHKAISPDCRKGVDAIRLINCEALE